MRTRAATVLLGAATGVGWLATVRPPGVRTAAPDQAIVAGAGWAAWAVAGYLLCGVAVAAGELAVGPGRRRLAARVVPGLVRRLVEAVAGAGLATVVVVSPTAVALADSPPPAPGPGLSLDWPGIPVAPEGAGPTSPATAAVVVARGDSLWRIAARGLGPHPSAAQVAAAWPRWWHANRSVIGRDPDHLQPGERLVPPTPTPRRPR